MPDHNGLNQGQDPLRGVVLCCTSIPPEQRSEMSAIAQQMGAVHKLDLTSDVTHLIVGNIDTPKYKYVAKERQDIKVLQPAWLDAVRDSWIQGEETGVAALEEQFRLPTFSRLQICVTGFDDIVQRNEIQDTVTANGASYHGDLTKAITHLIAVSASGKKYEYAGLWGIKIVTLEWLQDSLARGMALDESLYHPLMAPENRGVGAVSRRRMPSPLLGKRTRGEFQPAEPTGGAKRKLRRTASTRLESQNDDLWADIGSGETSQAVAGQEESTKEATSNVGFVNLEQKDRRSSTSAKENSLPEKTAGTVRKVDSGIFSIDSQPVKVFIRGFDKRKMDLLQCYMSDGGAKLLSEGAMRQRAFEKNKGARSDIDEVRVVVPHNANIDALGALVDDDIIHRHDKLVNEWWVEMCLHKKRLVNHEEEPLCEPFKTFPIPGFENLVICPTSFTGVDLLLFSKATKLMGASYDESLRPETSVLVCYEASANPGKLRYALENKIPVVSAAWFYDSIRKGRLQPFNEYALSTSRQSQKSSQGCFFHPILNPRPSIATPQHVPKSKGDRSAVRPQQRRGCLDLTRDPRPETLDGAASEDGRESSLFRGDSIKTTNEVSRPLQTLSPSKQNTQQGETLSMPPDQSGNEDQPLRAQSESNSKTDSLFRVEPLKASHPPKGFHSETDSNPSRRETGESRSAPSRQNTTEPAAEAESQNNHATSLNTAITALLAQQQQKAASSLSSRPSSASSAVTSAAPDVPRQKRTLGRAPSNGSAAISRTESWDGRGRPAQIMASAPVATAADDDLLDARGGPQSFAETAAERRGFRPSQALSYEDPEGAAMREKLMRRLDASNSGLGGFGAHHDADGKGKGQRVESIGVVKDAGPAEDRKRRATRRK